MIRIRFSGSGRAVLLMTGLLATAGVLLLLLLQLRLSKTPEDRLRLISEEGTVIYYNTRTVTNVDRLLSGDAALWQEKLRVANYLLRPVFERIQIKISVIHRLSVYLSALYLTESFTSVQIRDLSLLISDGSSSIGSSAASTGITLYQSGLTGEVRSTIKDGLQQSIRSILNSELQVLRTSDAYQSAVVVLEKKDQKFVLRALVDTADDGTGRSRYGFNGALLVRQAGSVLKPFVYGIGFERFGLLPDDPIDDTPLLLMNGDEMYNPRNHDNQFAGRLTIREALASSRNIPAVRMLSLVGVSTFAEFLHDAGLTHIVTEDADRRYGPSLALGTGGSSPFETAVLFSILASGGEQLPVLIGSDDDGDLYLDTTGHPVRDHAPARRRFSYQTAQLITEVLSDGDARRISFGKRNFLDFPFDVAAKTGTSQSFRDSWTAGYTDRYVVAVWVGNYSGGSMNSVSGVRGAARIFHQVIRLLVAGDRPLFRRNDWNISRAIDRNANESGQNQELTRQYSDHQIASALLDEKIRKLVLSPRPNQTFYLDVHRKEGQLIPFECSEQGLVWLWHSSADGGEQPVLGWQGRTVSSGRQLLSLSEGQYRLKFASQSGRQSEFRFTVR